ncbi:PadR family transcriptional regulator [Breznakia blatticola]|uniref:PadR family transcriptional regulator n=1 Tax=Breznakia blatticola TaxID=1754012 RepID=A0A4R7Z8X4_9FIRM|nr:PadR family transcriptional regulator [Breznakia blatticola]TDW13190.1 PadR family transcriptional regulator [Breznakia blatticola]
MIKQTEMLKGVLEGLVLDIIKKQETYGYEITKTLNEQGFEDVVEGTVYTILIRLEKNGWVDISKKPSSIGPMRKFYTLNTQGQQQLDAFWRSWNELSTKIQHIQKTHLED